MLDPHIMKHDFEVILVKMDDDIDEIILDFFKKHSEEIKLDSDLIIDKIKKTVHNDRLYLKRTNNESKLSFVKHYVDSYKNNGVYRYVYAVKSMTV